MNLMMLIDSSLRVTTHKSCVFTFKNWFLFRKKFKAYKKSSMQACEELKWNLNREFNPTNRVWRLRNKTTNDIEDNITMESSSKLETKKYTRPNVE